MNDIDYLHMTQYELYMKHESKTYPPRVIYQIGKRNEDIVMINFSGLDNTSIMRSFQRQSVVSHVYDNTVIEILTNISILILDRCK